MDIRCLHMFVIRQAPAAAVLLVTPQLIHLVYVGPKDMMYVECAEEMGRVV
jgi:hypothetical protein